MKYITMKLLISRGLGVLLIGILLLGSSNISFAQQAQTPRAEAKVAVTSLR